MSRHRAETDVAAALSRPDAMEALLNRLELREKQPSESGQLEIAGVYGRLSQPKQHRT